MRLTGFVVQGELRAPRKRPATRVGRKMRMLLVILRTNVQPNQYADVDKDQRVRSRLDDCHSLGHVNFSLFNALSRLT